MGYILLGHGGLNVDTRVTSPEMEYVAIPQGTTIQFYADTGQGLLYGSHHLDIWSQLQAPWAPLDSSNVTYNLSLQSAKELWDEELKNDPDFGGHTLVRAGVDGVPDPIRMCSGTPSTCPTDPRRVAEGATHRCDGILAQYTGDLYWLACTSVIRADKAVMTTALEGEQRDVLMGEDPDWAPDESDFEAIAEVNRANVKATDDGDSVDVLVGGFVALIGDGHDPTHQRYARWVGDKEAGKVTVHKGGIMSAGSLEVTGISPSKQGVVEAAIARFSDKDVEFG